MKRKVKAKFVVELELPPTATKTDARGYIEECVRSWRGSLFPGNDFEDADPMWDLDPNSVKVSFYRREKTKAILYTKLDQVESEKK